MNTPNLFSLFQFADGLFPAGSYAHSLGLETAVQAGEVQDAAGVERFISAYLEMSAGPLDAVAVSCSWQSARNEDFEACLSLDAALEAMKPASELRDASRQMGRQTARVGAHLCKNRTLEHFYKGIEARSTPGHHAIAFGIAGSAFGWPRRATVAAYLYSSGAALASASLRLLRLGQLEAQRVLWNLAPLLARLAADACSRRPEEMWSFAPAQEIASMRHAHLEARLFRS